MVNNYFVGRSKPASSHFAFCVLPYSFQSNFRIALYYKPPFALYNLFMRSWLTNETLSFVERIIIKIVVVVVVVDDVLLTSKRYTGQWITCWCRLFNERRVFTVLMSLFYHKSAITRKGSFSQKVFKVREKAIHHFKAKKN